MVGFFFGYRNKPQNSETGLDEIYKKIEEESLKWDERYKPVKDLSTALKGGTRRGKLGEIALEVLLEKAQLPKTISEVTAAYLKEMIWLVRLRY